MCAWNIMENPAELMLPLRISSELFPPALLVSEFCSVFSAKVEVSLSILPPASVARVMEYT